MKPLLFVLTISLLFGCSKESDKPDILGNTYSGYSYTSIFGGEKMYRGYMFISDNMATELLLEENSKVIAQKEVGYKLTYPDIKIEGDNTADGYWYGTFTDANTLQIRSIMMKKW